MQVTLKDVAEASGYSITTVSRALSGYDDVSPKTREHIAAIAAELGYQPNLVARQLRSQRTDTIGMIIPSDLQYVEDDFFSSLLRGVTHTAARHSFDVLISACTPGANEMDAYRRIVGGNRVDGVIVTRTYRDDPRIAYLKSIRHPFVVSGRAAPDHPSDFPFIDVDSQRGIAMLTAHFIDYGHRHIGLILPGADIAYTGYRLAGYQSALNAAGLPLREDYITHGDLTRRGGYQGANRLLDHAPELTAVIACNDLMALGAMRAMTERGLTVGVDVAVGGFDDIPEAALAAPGLTTVRQPIYLIGERLAEILIQWVTRKPFASEGILLEPELVVRGSSGLPKKTEHER